VENTGESEKNQDTTRAWHPNKIMLIAENYSWSLDMISNLAGCCSPTVMGLFCKHVGGEHLHNAKCPAQYTHFHSQEKTVHFKSPESGEDH